MNHYTMMLSVWLAFLVIFEGVSIYESTRSPLHEVFPLFNEANKSQHGPALVLFFQFVVTLLLGLRAFALTNRYSVDHWKIMAGVHVFEAFAFGYLGFRVERTLPMSVSDFHLEEHAYALLIFGAIVFNAFLFTGHYLLLKYEADEFFRQQRQEQLAEGKRAIQYVREHSKAAKVKKRD